MNKFKVYGASTPEESVREKEHRLLAEKAAAEGIVLLKNDNVLPMKPSAVALYGAGSRRTVKGGSGSGDVRERSFVTIEEGLKRAGFTFPTTLWMDRFEEKYQKDIAAWHHSVEEAIKGYGPVHTMDMFIKIGELPKPNPSCTPVQTDELTDMSDAAIYVLSRQAGEGKDRKVSKGDYLFSDIEKNSLKTLSDHYKKLILVINCGGVIDLSILDETRIDAVLLVGQSGMEIGNAVADVITGSVTPSGKLTDTWAYHYQDYPAAETYAHRNGNLEQEDYVEGIYVGYRWFDKNEIKPRFPFGFGLSYTQFDCTVQSFENDGSNVNVNILVKNSGNKYSGKEVIQLYLQKPDTGIDHEKRALAAFSKTRLLKPGEQQETELSFNLNDLACFDEEKNCFYLENGIYKVMLFDRICGTIELKQQKIVEQVHFLGKDMPATIKYAPTKRSAAILSRLTKKEKCMLVTGGGYAIRAYNNVMGAAGRTCTKLLNKGIPNIVFADGPAGLNVLPVTAVGPEGFPRYPEGLPEDWKWGWLTKVDKLLMALPGKQQLLYRYMTAWPNGTVLAQSWNCELLEQVGKAIGKEMLEIGVSIWLAPGMNIHRNPLCGRNFEYYSEDPLISGKMAASVIRGVQSNEGVGVSVKHFCCNNQEDNRIGVSSNVSQRALREIYLRAFRIAITEGRPWTIMSSYNKVNGKYVCNSSDFLTHLLREEWGFEGIVISDWNALDQCSCTEAINAGNDLNMPGNKAAVTKILNDTALNDEALTNSAGRVLDLIFKSSTCKDFEG
ncbi:MAG: glycoside hydrolase family 3 C-terminal domain-containing protein [Solobacterium sp.]|jgi:beta-glucosidase|nr:glycoside hydrolase family 3 C-terminal domain-containing protein [Solobacterium sp.]